MTPAIWRWVQGIGTSSVLALLVLVGNFTLGVRDSMRDLPRELGRIEDRLGTQIEMIRQGGGGLKRGGGNPAGPGAAGRVCASRVRAPRARGTGSTGGSRGARPAHGGAPDSRASPVP